MGTQLQYGHVQQRHGLWYWWDADEREWRGGYLFRPMAQTKARQADEQRNWIVKGVAADMATIDPRNEDGQLRQDGTDWYWWDAAAERWRGPFSSERAAKFGHTALRNGECVPVQATHTPEEVEPAYPTKATPFKPTPFQKHDSGKLRWGLVPFDAVSEVIKVLMYGAEKYEDHNWSKGTDWSRYFDAAMRHMAAWWMRDPHDPETRLSHLAHAACCMLFLLAYELRNLGKDDRP